VVSRFVYGAVVGGLVSAGALGAASVLAPGDVAGLRPLKTESAAPSTAAVPKKEALAQSTKSVETEPEKAVTLAEGATPPATADVQLAGPDDTVVHPDQPANAPAGKGPDLSEMVTRGDDPFTPLMPDLEDERPSEMLQIADLPAPLIPSEPGQPAVLDSDEVPAAAEAPEPPPIKAAPVQIAEAEPEVADPAVIAPGPQVQPERAVEAQAEEDGLPGADAPSMPGKPAGTLPSTEAAPEDAEVATLPEPEEENPATLKPTPGFGAKTEGVITNRLPRVGIGQDTAPETEVAVADAKPLDRFARPFENAEGKPLFAIVLIDDGSADLDRQSLAALPFAVSFAIDPLSPEAANHSAIYRAAGQEVLTIATGIAEGAQASDVEVAFQSMEQGLPESVAVMDKIEGGFQANRPLSSLVVPVVAAQGRGLLTWDQGLNAADQVARREGLPATVVFRSLDEEGEDRKAIRLSLDRAAFKAAQDGRVTVVGTARPETVAALMEWTVEGRAATVALAPISAAMTATN
jgi:uncharacterized protein